jgi:hypothetical protein
VVCLSAGEERRLLALPDLVHELGHNAWNKAPVELAGDLFNTIREAVGRIPDSAVPVEWDAQEFRDEAFYAWQESWLEELACDLIATYAMGPSFAWQHLRLWAMTADGRSPLRLDLAAVHPPDEARMSAVQFALARLKSAGVPLDASHLSWQSVTAGTSTPEEGEIYQAVFSPQLLEAIADQILNACKTLALTAFAPTGQKGSIPRLVSDAWAMALTAPREYAVWEETQMERLWKELLD